MREKRDNKVGYNPNLSVQGSSLGRALESLKIYRIAKVVQLIYQCMNLTPNRIKRINRALVGL